ncbi:RAMP superfamily protein [Actinopolyspora erythraea]|uniref:RAMP superfamily protein n=1 Tax=Actinopolyspora erythraea TaxID=414996 RepID=A0A099D2X4_9ACTN|nr:RAMP superfamily CRISPR-associated protein [Actinopolyspora erythraea]ASU77598.1 RAMP superfamily protein [Actinopolyspora erythraea]KGI80404.1 RAMP superfamily protein [Actinopolyspora erythraea]
MKSTVEFEIIFHGPFRVSTGHARSGVDSSVPDTERLPNTSLKGVMRASAKRLLGEEAAIIGEVFGSYRHESPWRWKSAKPGSSNWPAPQPAARVRIDPNTHSASENMLAVSEQTWAERARFSVQSRGHLSEETLRKHRLVLAVTGQAVHSLGAETRRGLGWVGISCTNVELDERSVAEFLELKAA